MIKIQNKTKQKKIQILARITTRRSKVALFVALFVVLVGYLVYSSFAAGTLLVAKIPNANVQPGDLFSISVRVNSDTTAINAVGIRLSYDDSKADFVSASNVGTPFGIVAAKSTAGGVVSVDEAINAGSPAVSGDQLASTIMFRAKSTAAGTMALNFTSLSKVYSAKAVNQVTNIANQSTGVTVTFAPAVGTKLVFGAGDEAANTTTTGAGLPIFGETSMRMTTAWFNQQSDMTWVNSLATASNQTMSNVYGQGKATELIVSLQGDPTYAVSDKFQTDLATMIKAYKGNGPNYGTLYVVLYSGFENYSADVTYANSLKAAYLKAVNVVHSNYDQAEVALGFNSNAWATGTTQRDLGFWSDAILASDFNAVQTVADCTKVDGVGQSTSIPQIQGAVRQLGAYGLPVMMSSFKFTGAATCQTDVFGKFLTKLFGATLMTDLVNNRLFAWNFSSEHYINDPGTTHQAAITTISGMQRGGVTPPIPAQFTNSDGKMTNIGITAFPKISTNMISFKTIFNGIAPHHVIYTLDGVLVHTENFGPWCYGSDNGIACIPDDLVMTPGPHKLLVEARDAADATMSNSTINIDYTIPN